MTELRERLQKTPRSPKNSVPKQLDLEGQGEAKREIIDVVAHELKEEQAKSASE